MPQDLQTDEQVILFGIEYDLCWRDHAWLNNPRGNNAIAFQRAGLQDERHALGRLYYGIRAEMSTLNNWPCPIDVDRCRHSEVTRLYNFMKSLEALQCLARA